MKRGAKIQRKTNETDINLCLEIDGLGNSEISTGIGFFDHMLISFAKHGLFDIQLLCKGDLDVDQHHTVEDVGIALGAAFQKALGKKLGISRAGYFVYPMDEALAVVAVDLGGRAYLQFDCKFKRQFVGDFDTDLLEDFFDGFAKNCLCNLVVRMPFGRSDHHKIEATFKAFAKAMKQACKINPQAKEQIPSTKGVV